MVFFKTSSSTQQIQLIAFYSSPSFFFTKSLLTGKYTKCYIHINTTTLFYQDAAGQHQLQSKSLFKSALSISFSFHQNKWGSQYLITLIKRWATDFKFLFGTLQDQLGPSPQLCQFWKQPSPTLSLFLACNVAKWQGNSPWKNAFLRSLKKWPKKISAKIILSQPLFSQTGHLRVKSHRRKCFQYSILGITAAFSYDHFVTNSLSQKAGILDKEFRTEKVPN